MVKRVKSFFNTHSYKETCNIEPTADFNYVGNWSTIFSNNPANKNLLQKNLELYGIKGRNLRTWGGLNILIK